jgi:hypothetical protein
MQVVSDGKPVKGTEASLHLPKPAASIVHEVLAVAKGHWLEPDHLKNCHCTLPVHVVFGDKDAHANSDTTV